MSEHLRKGRGEPGVQSRLYPQKKHGRGGWLCCGRERRTKAVSYKPLLPAKRVSTRAR
jgi:predicted RNA-binding protein YlxR (DUF448 family)